MKLRASPPGLVWFAILIAIWSRQGLAGTFSSGESATAPGVFHVAAQLPNDTGSLMDGANPTTLADPVIVGLGDSVAAGYGLGIDDNPYSYPSLVFEQWGSRHGYLGLNLATSGATSSDIVIPGGQLDKARELEPDIVTLTVGANDIHFAYCLAELLTDPEGAPTLCQGDHLTVWLRRLHKNLNKIFSALHRANPAVQIYITTYYDPLPARPGSRENPGPTSCEVFKAEALLIYGSRNLEKRSAYLQDVAYASAEGVIKRLNRTIDRAASQHPYVHVISVHHLFSPVGALHHDFCDIGPLGWVFGPSFVTSPPVSLILPPGALPEPCPDPRAPQDTTPIVDFGPLLQIFLNCTPHPTEVGQQQIADAVCAEFPSTMNCAN
jgi:lysophospholipase L1-like esterase